MLRSPLRPVCALAMLSVPATLVWALDDENCVDWAAAGYCESDSHAKYMALHCATACTEQATSLAEGEAGYAADGDSCTDWANAGYCENEEYAEYMQAKCRDACGQPGEGDGVAGLAAGAGPSLAADWGLGSLLGWVGSLRGRAQDAPEEGLPSTDSPDTTQHGNCVAWAEHGYCYAGANQQYMQQSCADECEQGQRAGTIPEPGKLWQAPILDCHGYRLRGACGSHASFMFQHCEEVCSSSTVELPPSDILSQIGALLLLGGFCYAVFRGSKLALTYDAQLSWHTRRAINMETAAETAALATDKAKGGRKKSTTYSERMQARRGEKEKAKKS